MITLEQLRAFAPQGKLDILNGIVEHQEILTHYEINPGHRLQMFMAQVAHESAGFRATREYASGKAYENRKDLGNTNPGDGVRYKGRGLIQLTGRFNYRAYSPALGFDAEANPELLEQMPQALLVAALYWHSRGLNKLADEDKFTTITKRINGGVNGLQDRLNYLARAKEIWPSPSE